MDEFKALQFTNNIIASARDFFRQYTNAFINSAGGRLWFGIEDDSEVKGLFLTDLQKSILSFLFKQTCKQLIPPISENTYSISFIPVQLTIQQYQNSLTQDINEKYASNVNVNIKLLKPQNIDLENQIINDFVDDLNIKYKKYVVVAQVAAGTCSIYSNLINQSWVRRDAGIYMLTNEFIKQRITEQNQQYFTTQSYFQSHLQLINDIQNAIDINADRYSIINIYGLPGVGKHQIIRNIVEKYSNHRVFYFNSNTGFKEMEDQIKVQYYQSKNTYVHKPFIVWDDLQYIEQMQAEVIEKRLKRVVGTFNKHIVVFIISRRNVLINITKSRSVFSFQCNQLSILEAATLVKAHLPVATELLEENDQNYMIQLARLNYHLGYSCVTFATNCVLHDIGIKKAITKLSKTAHHQRLQFLAPNLERILNTIPNEQKQFIASFYMYDNIIHQQTRDIKGQIEILYNNGLFGKTKNGSYYQIQCVRKYCMEYVDETKVKQQISNVLNFYLEQLMLLQQYHDEQRYDQFESQLCFVLIEEYDSYLFLLNNIQKMIKFSNQYVVSVGVDYFNKFFELFSNFEILQDCNFHRKLNEIKIITQQISIQNNVQECDSKEWGYLWSQFI